MAGVTWYAFDFKDYLSDTARLSCEAHGAYIQLIADYYNTKQPLPDDDFILAAVTKLPIEQWQKHRKVISRYFTVADGVWRHERIEREIKDSCEKHAASKARAQAGAAAMHAKRGHRTVSERAEPPKSSKSTPQAAPQAVLEQGAKHADLHLQEDSLSTAPEMDLKEGAEDGGIGTLIDPNYRPPPAMIAACLKDADPSDLELEIQKFVYRRRDEGGFSNDWDGAFGMWWARFKEHRAKSEKAAAKKVAPRIEVNTSSIDTSMEATFERALKLFAKGGNWPRSIGPEPGQPGCRIPPDVIRKHGIDPATGLKLREPAT